MDLATINMYLSTSDIQYYSLGKAGVVLVPTAIPLKAAHCRWCSAKISIVILLAVAAPIAGYCLKKNQNLGSSDANRGIFKF